MTAEYMIELMMEKLRIMSFEVTVIQTYPSPSLTVRVKGPLRASYRQSIAQSFAQHRRA